jgi:hypothetical protein
MRGSFVGTLDLCDWESEWCDGDVMRTYDPFESDVNGVDILVTICEGHYDRLCDEI